jgi:hypothetical protein
MLFALLPLISSILHCIVLKGCEREVAEASNGDSDERKNESIMRLSWALVHSRKQEDVQRGIAMLESKMTLLSFFIKPNNILTKHIQERDMAKIRLQHSFYKRVAVTE